jgi:hypothetical protein
MAIGEKDRRPRSDYPRMRIVRFSKLSLEFGQEIHDIEGVPTRVFSIREDCCGLLQIPEQDRSRRRTGSSPRVDSKPQGDDGRPVASRQGLPGSECDEPYMAALA